MLDKLNTVRTRLILWYVFFLALTILGFSLFLYLELQRSLSTQVDAGLEVAASQLLVDVDDTVNPPILRPMSERAVDHIMQSRFALRMVTENGDITADVGGFPPLTVRTYPTPTFETILIDGIPWRIYTQRIETQAQQLDVWVQMAQSLNVIDEARHNLLRLFLIGLPIILLAVGFGGVFMANRALRPVDTITRTAQTINATDMTRRIVYRGPADEMGRLAATLNSMLDRLQAAFETERRFTADASHELRTPLTAIKGHISVALTRQRTEAEYVSTLQHIQHDTDRLIRVVNDLLFLARLDSAPPRHAPELLNLSDLLHAVIDQLHPIAEAQQTIIRAELPENAPLYGIPDHLIRLFLNLLDNAVKHSSPNGLVRIGLAQTPRHLIVTVRDNGRGIPPEHLPHVFERFYRIERDRSSQSGGVGLGLAIAQQIAVEHQGRIEVESTPGVETSFSVYLAATQPLRLQQ